MKIRRRGKSFQLDLGMVDGKRVFRQFKTRGEAEDEMVTAKAKLRREGESGLSISDAERSRYAAAADRLSKAGASIEQAVEFYIKHHAGIEDLITVDELVKRCILDKAASNTRPRYIDQLKCSIKAFARIGHGERRVDEISADDVRDWLLKSGWAPKTQKVYLTDLKTAFAWAIERRYATMNPCVAVKPPTLDDKPPGILTVQDAKSLLDAALEHDERYGLLAYFAVGMFAGIRPEEMGRVVWSEIHLEESFIEVPARKAKSRRRRIVDISPNLSTWLHRAKRTEGERLTPANFAKRFRALRKLAKITTWPHDALRHCFASYHLAKHGSAEKTSAQLGHEDTQMLYQHYRELVRPRDAAAFWELLPADPRRD